MAECQQAFRPQPCLMSELEAMVYLCLPAMAGRDLLYQMLWDSDACRGLAEVLPLSLGSWHRN